MTDRDTSSLSPSCRTHTCVTGTQDHQRLKSRSVCPPYGLSVKHSEHLLFKNAFINKYSQPIKSTLVVYEPTENTDEELHDKVFILISNQQSLQPFDFLVCYL